LKKLRYSARKSFTLYEILITIVIFAILSAITFKTFKSNTLVSDYKIIKAKILQIKSNALGYQQYDSDPYHCITLTKTALNNENDKVEYKINSAILLNGTTTDTICFDYLGRAYEDKVDKDMVKLLKNKVTVMVRYNGEERNITIYPFGGDIN